MLMWRGFVRRNFISHHRWNGRESTNQLQQHISHIETLYFLFHRLLVDNITIYPGFYPVLAILNISHSSLPTRRAFLCFFVLPDALKTMTCRVSSQREADLSWLTNSFLWKTLQGSQNLYHFSSDIISWLTFLPLYFTPIHWGSKLGYILFGSDFPNAMVTIGPTTLSEK